MRQLHRFGATVVRTVGIAVHWDSFHVNFELVRGKTSLTVCMRVYVQKLRRREEVVHVSMLVFRCVAVRLNLFTSVHLALLGLPYNVRVRESYRRLE